MAVPAVLLHPEDRIDPKALLDRQALTVLMARSPLEVPVVQDHLADQIGLARKP